MEDIIIIGSGGLGKEILEILLNINNVKPTWNILGFIDDDESKIGSKIHGYPVLGNCYSLKDKNINAVVAIGYAKQRHEILKKIIKYNLNFPIIIHPNAIISNFSIINRGTIVSPNTYISSDTRIGEFCYIGTNSTIGHDVIIHDFVSVLPSCTISGNVSIDSITTIGSGTTILQNVVVGKNAFIGAQSLVNKDISNGSIAYGVPAKRIKDFI